MDFGPCAEALNNIIVSNQPSIPVVNPYAIPAMPGKKKLNDILNKSKDNELSHKQKCRKNKKAEKSKGYFEQQELKAKRQKMNEKKKDKKKKNKGQK